MAWRRGQSYAQDLRDRVFAAADAGSAVGKIAETLFVTSSYVSKVLARRRDTGETAARPQRCHVPPKLQALLPAIRQQVADKPDATIEELCAWLLNAHKTSASITLMWETLGHLGLTLKKRPCTPRSSNVPMSPGRARNGGRNSPAWTPRS